MSLATALSVSAQMPTLRATASTHGSTKQINIMGHKDFQRPTMRKTVGEAPANTAEVPFTHDLGKGGTEVKNYTAIDANGDGRTWKFGSVNGYAACMPPNTADIDASDDWLITVPVHMTPGDYTLSFEVGMMGSGAVAVEFEAWLFSSPDLDGKLAEIAPTTRHTIKDLTPYEFTCAIPEEGYYYFGIHCTTAKADKGTMKLTNLGVKAGAATPPVKVDPPAAGILTYELAPKGELKATVTYVAPTKTKSGADLESISKVELTSRWNVDKFTFTDVQPGQTITQEVEMYAGINNRFSATAYVDETAGETVEIKNIFCGPDNPLPPTDVTLTVDPGYKSATLSWTAPGEVGERGGYVDPEKLTYYVFDAFGSYYDPALYTTDQTSVTIDYSSLEGQDFFAYQVTAGIDETYYSLDVASDIIVAGAPAALPFRESFAGGLYDGIWCIDPESTGGSTQNWGTVSDEYFASLIDPDDPEAPTPLTSHDGDNGFYYWLPYDASAQFGLISVRTDISAAANPVLEFYVQGQGSLVEVLIASGTDSKLEVAKSVDLKENPTTGWTLVRVPLDAYKANGTVQFELRLSAIHNDDEHTWSVPIDNIRIRDLAPADIRIVTASLPSKAAPGDAVNVAAHIENLGTDTASAVSASLTVGGTAVATKQLDAIESGAFADVNFEYTVPLNAPAEFEMAIVINNANDVTPADNTVAATVTVRRPNFATVTDLKAAPDGLRNVELTWSEPVNESSVATTVSEDFESEEYTPMSISGCGGWTVYDGDGVKTYNVFRELNNPYQTQPIGFQLFNRVVAQVPDKYWTDAEPHSGDAFMLAPSSQSADNDNWLISPALSGSAQTVTFWAKSLMISWPESMEVYYSTTDNQPASFTSKVEISGEFINETNVPEVWTQYTVVLPEGATYFAIRHFSNDTLALLVDDVTYESQPEIPADLAIVGYHVFRNGTQITAEPVNSTTFTDSPLGTEDTDGTYNFFYTVVPIYNYGPVLESNRAEVSFECSGIEDVAIDALDRDAVVYTVSGIRMATSSLTEGIYILVEDNEARKVHLRR